MMDGDGHIKSKTGVDALKRIGALRTEIKEAGRQIELAKMKRKWAIDTLVTNLDLSTDEAKSKLQKRLSNLILFSFVKTILEYSDKPSLTSSELLENVRPYRKTNSNSFRSALSRFREAGLLRLDRENRLWSLPDAVSVSQPDEG